MDEAGRRRQRRRQLVRSSLEAGAATTLVVVALAAFVVVLNVGQGRSAPPPGTLVVSQSGDFQSLDPALATSREAWELEYATCAKLLDYPPKSGAGGSRLVAEVARSLPAVSPDGLAYTFRIAPGWRFSNGESVGASAFARAFERARSPRLVSPAAAYLREVESWRADGDTLTVRLSHRAPDFPQRLALPYFCAVPPSTPESVTEAPPSAGPFTSGATSGTGHSSSCGTRTTRGRGGRHVDRIEYRFGAFASQIGLQLDRGEADYGVVPPSVFESFAARIGSSDHLFTVPQPIVGYLALNTARPLFRGNPQLRRAVNYALDRPALARAFGARAARPTDQYLPPGSPGYHDASLYPLGGPDLEKARRLADGHLRAGKAVYLACPGMDCRAPRRDRGEEPGRDRARRRDPLTGYGQYALAGVRGTGFDIADVVTRPDYGDPYGIVEKLLDGRAIRAVGNTNLLYYADPAFSRAIDAAQRLRGRARMRAYERLDVDVARRSAPLAAYANVNARVFLSRRVGCVTYQPVFGLDIAGLCLRSWPISLETRAARPRRARHPRRAPRPRRSPRGATPPLRGRCARRTRSPRGSRRARSAPTLQGRGGVEDVAPAKARRSTCASSSCWATSPLERTGEVRAGRGVDAAERRLDPPRRAPRVSLEVRGERCATSSSSSTARTTYTAAPSPASTPLDEEQVDRAAPAGGRAGSRA